jgi:flagellar biosynthesis activator protein FlaF
MPDLHTHAATAYGSTLRTTVEPRQLEANVLLKAARQLEEVRQSWMPERGTELEDALMYNRKLWTVFATEAADDGNPLPLPIRNNTANIAVFVFKRTLELQAAPAPEKIDPLIEINRNLAAGLLASIAASSHAAAQSAAHAGSSASA